jgi:peptidoglycan hydrolase CwlO-like protein
MDHVAPPPLRTRVARLVATAIAAAALATALPAAAAHAQAAPDPVAAADAAVADLRAQADALADHYFETLGRVSEIQQKADEIEAKLPALRTETARLRALTRERAVEAYKRAGRNLGAVVGARDPLAAARRARWLQRLNERDDAAVTNLQGASAKLDAQRAALRAARDDAERTLADVKAQGDQIDALLAQAEQQRQTAVAAAAAPAVTESAAAGGATPSGSELAASPTTTTSPSSTTTTATPTATPPPPPPTYVPTPGVHPHHDDPFLVCTRTRESGGNYAAYNPAGPYMGAYQFLQSTWNSAANHAGRTALVGVPPSVASQYDQDDMAWTLYQWQGSRPWGGLCDGAT